MGVEILTDYLNVVTFIICMCVGYIVKNVVPTEKINAFIPLICGILGVVLMVWGEGAFTPQIVAVGLISGLASTGGYELVRNIIAKVSGKGE